MSIKSYVRYLFIALTLLAFAGTAAAQGPRLGNTTTSSLEMSANVVTVVQLNISTATNGATVAVENASTGSFTLDFGNVNGLGLGTDQLATNVSVSPDESGALYKTKIKLTPIYAGFTTETATVTVDKGSSGDEDMAREGDESISSSSTVTTSHAVFSEAASGSANERWVGFYVPRSAAAAAKTATLIYTITVE